MLADGSQIEGLKPETETKEVSDPFESLLSQHKEDPNFVLNDKGENEAWVAGDKGGNMIEASDRFAAKDTSIPENETPAEVIDIGSLDKEVKSEKRETTELSSDLAQIKKETLAKLEKAETEALAEEEKITKMESEAAKLNDTIKERKEVVAHKLAYIRRMKEALSQSEEETPEQLVA